MKMLNLNQKKIKITRVDSELDPMFLHAAKAASSTERD